MTRMMIAAMSALASVASFAATDYVVAVEKHTKADPAWNAVVETLRTKHAATLLEYDGNDKLREILPGLRRNPPKFVCFVSKPETAGRDLVVRAAQLLRQIDDDPYGDALWGIITGFNAADAMRLAKVPKTKEIRRVATSMGFPDTLDPWCAGFASDEWNRDNFWRRLPGGTNEKIPTGGDPAKTLAEAFNTIDVDYFVTSGHGHMRNWQIIYNKNEGYLRHDDQARLIFHNPAKETFPITKASPKVYLAAGNCLIGNIDQPACMTTAWLHSGGAEQICAYTHVTFFGFMGWGVKSQFEEARCSFSEAFYLQNQLLLWATLNIRDGALAKVAIDPAVFAHGTKGLIQAHEKAVSATRDGKTGVDSASVGYLWDRDLVAFYGDPAYQVTFPKTQRTLDVSVKGNAVTVEFLKDVAFGELLEYKSPRPVVKLLETPPPGTKLVDAQGKPVERAVVNDRFLLIPLSGQHRHGERLDYRIVN